MVRKIGKKNIKLFVLFSFLVLLVIGLFGYGVYTAFSYDKKEYAVANGSFTYDADNNYVKLENEAVIQQRWDKKYYLTDSSNKKNKVYNLGTDVVVYNDNDMNLKIYGSNFQIATNGDVTFNDKELEVSRNSSALFYKLDDRKYLMISKSIYTEKKEVNTSSYLIVQIDKSGNALLLNNELNVKTLSTLVLKTAGYEFDVANEKLIIPNSKKVIDLKKVSGSSNQYVEPSTDEEEDKDKDKDKDTDNTGNTGNNNGASNNGGSSATTGSAASSIINSTINNNAKDLNIIKTAFVTSVQAYTSYIDVYYSVNDPKGEYISIFLDVTGTDGYSNRIILNKDLTRYRIRNLNSNTQYSISFGYSYASKENSDIILEDIANSFVVKTNKNQTKVTITKLSGRKIYYNVLFDSSYAFESASAVVYSDNMVIGRDNVNAAAASRSGGYNGIIDCDNDFGYEIVVKLEDCKFDGETIEANISTKFING